MPAKIPVEKTRKAVWLHINGYTRDQIAENVGIATGTVQNIITDFKEGNFPEYEDLPDFVDDVRWLLRELRTKNRSLKECVIGMTVYDGLTHLGIEPAQLMQVLQLLPRISPPDFPADQFARRVLYVTTLESQMGMSLPEMESKATRLASDIASRKSEKADLEDRINSAKASEKQARDTLEDTLSRNKITQQSLNQYIEDQELLEKSNLTIDDVKAAADCVRKAGTQGVLDAARELFTIESQTGKNIAAQVEEYGRTVASNEKLRSESNHLAIENSHARSQLLQQNQSITEQMKKNRVTEEELAEHVTVRRRLTARGLDMGRPGILERILTECEEQGWNSNTILRYVGGIKGLEEQSREAKNEAETTQKELDLKKKRLQEIKGEIATETAHYEKIRSMEAEGEKRILESNQQVENNTNRLELAETWLSLHQDPANTSDLQIKSIIDRLELVLKARKETQRLPIDYDSLREQMLLRVKGVLGPEIILKENRNDWDRLKRERLQFESEKKAFKEEKLEFETASREKLLRTAVDLLNLGVISAAKCPRCRSIFVYHIGYKLYSKFLKCPLCLTSL